MKFYLHNNYDMGEIVDMVKEEYPDKSEKFHRTLAEELYSKFYEIGFEVHHDNEGNLTGVVPLE